MLKTAITTLISTDVPSKALQLEFLKSALVQVNTASQGGRSLVACAEQLLSTASNSSWIDRELMYEFFFRRVGLGAAASRKCASACVDRNIPSPQYLALACQTSDAARELGLNEHQSILLHGMLNKVLHEIGRALPSHSCDRDSGELRTAAAEAENVWVEVGSPDSPPDGVEGHQDASTASAPPPTPATPDGGGCGGEDPDNAVTARVNVVQVGSGLSAETMGKGLPSGYVTRGERVGLDPAHDSSGSEWFLAFYETDSSPFAGHANSALSTPSPDIYTAPTTPAPQLRGQELEGHRRISNTGAALHEPVDDIHDPLVCSTFTAISTTEDSASRVPVSAEVNSQVAPAHADLVGPSHSARLLSTDDKSWEVPLRAALFLPG